MILSERESIYKDLRKLDELYKLYNDPSAPYEFRYWQWENYIIAKLRFKNFHGIEPIFDEDWGWHCIKET